ncbi:MAG: protein kinase [Proteobacteria bacterium]|nr:protein kinase [Pseudomonadota bacterium]
MWAAGHSDGDLSVAVKVARVATKAAQQRFAGEAEALARVGPGSIPELYEYGTLKNGRPYIAMELLDGSPLSDHLGRLSAPPTLRRVRSLADAVLANLAAIHAVGLVHSDIKPDNVMLCSGDSAATSSGGRAGAARVITKILDLGSARRGDEPGQGCPEKSPADQLADRSTASLTGSEESLAVVGSIEYMAPEQFLSPQIDHRADIYAFGILLYELLTLRVPFIGDRGAIERGHQSLRPPRPSSIAEVAEPVEELCLACLSKEPTKRPHDVAELRHLLALACDRAKSADSSGAKPLTRTAPLLTDARQPVVLLVIDVEDTAPDDNYQSVVSGVERRKGVIARQQGKRYICGFSVLEDEAPAETALAAAREVVAEYGAEYGVRVALHLAQLKVRRRRKRIGSAFYGSALDNAESWLPGEPWSGILVTDKLAAVLPRSQTKPAPAHPGFCEIGPDAAAPSEAQAEQREPARERNRLATVDSGDVALVGRDDILAQARADLRRVLDSANPGLFTLYGESGLGKSRLADELAELARRECAQADVLLVRATRRVVGARDSAMSDLTEHLDERLSHLQAAQTADSGLGDIIRQVAVARPFIMVFDDAHYADSLLLDAVEYATLDGDEMPLWIATVAHPQLLRRRPQWGERAHQHRVVELQPLDEGETMKLAAELLRPAEYPPADVLRQLARWTAGSPHSLAELVRILKREGFVRKRPQVESWYIATAELDRLPPSPAEQWLAARRLDALPAELAACLRLCAVLGVEFLRDELEWVQDAAGHSGAASTSMDTDVGLSELKHLDFVEEHEPGVWSFRQAAFQDAVYKLVGERERRLIHGDALVFWRTHCSPEHGDRSPVIPGRSAPCDSLLDRVLAARARHAGASGAASEAADAYLALADRARDNYRDVDADHYYTSALAFIGESEHGRRARALGARGRVRYRIQRNRESLADLRAAQEHAVHDGDRMMLATLILEEATALDWAWLYDESANRVEAVERLISDSDEVELSGRYLNALARSHYRKEQMHRAIELYVRSTERSAACGDHETEIVALLLLALALVAVGEFDDAEKRFGEVIALCERTGDRFHLCTAYCNRVILSSVKKAVQDIAQDLRRAVKLAREIGQPTLERIATHNLAEFLHWSGCHSEALRLARRAYALQRFLPEPTPPDALLLARIHAALDHVDEARQMLEEVRSLAYSKRLTRFEQIATAVLDLTLSEQSSSSAWDELLRIARRNLPGEEFLEMLFFCARTAWKSRRWQQAADAIAEAQTKLDEQPTWRQSFAELAEKLPPGLSSAL